MNLYVTRVLTALLVLITSSVVAQNDVKAQQSDIFIRIGGTTLPKEFLKELPATPYETIGEKKILSYNDHTILNGSDIIEMTADSLTSIKNDNITIESSKKLIKQATKVWVREKILGVLSEEVPAMPDSVQENPDLDYTLTLLLKSGARIGIDWTIDATLSILLDSAAKQTQQP